MRFCLVSAVIQMFLAGFDTTSTVLSVTMYYLAKNQECQEKLSREVTDNFDNVDEELDYGKVQV